MNIHLQLKNKMKIKKRYVIHPGWQLSKNDGEYHYITAEQLVMLYNIKLEECFVHEDEIFGFDLYQLYGKKVIHLYPNYDENNYILLKN